MKILILVVAFLIAFSCSKGSDDAVATSSEKKDLLIPEEWQAEGIAKVIGYRFRIPGENAKGYDPIGYFSLCSKNVVDLKTLEKIKVKSVELDATKTKSLLDYVFSDTAPLPRVACYSPHQLFVFYDSAGDPKRAVEVCFICNSIKTIPPLPKAQLRKHDLKALAKLCSEIGLWAPHQNIEDYVPAFTEGWKPH